AFVLALGALLHRFRRQFARVPGLRFKWFLAGYLMWRVAIDFLKPVPAPYPLGLSGLQWLSLVFLAGYLPVVVAQPRRLCGAEKRGLISSTTRPARCARRACAPSRRRSSLATMRSTC